MSEPNTGMDQTTWGIIIGGIATVFTGLFGVNGYLRWRRDNKVIPQKVEHEVKDQMQPVESKAMQAQVQAAANLTVLLPLITELQDKVEEYERRAKARDRRDRERDQLWTKILVAWARHEAWDAQVVQIARKIDTEFPDAPSLSELLK